MKEIEKLYYDFIHAKFHPPQYLLMSEEKYEDVKKGEVGVDIAFVQLGNQTAIPLLIVKNHLPSFIAFV